MEWIKSKVVTSETGCWLWTGCKSPEGYANYYNVKVHRLTFTAANGPIPTGLHIDHLCRVRHCVNPAHLEAVTCRENLRRGEGFQGVNVRKTHCTRGHALAGSNLRIRVGVAPNGATYESRICRACSRLHTRLWQRRQNGARMDIRTHDILARAKAARIPLELVPETSDLGARQYRIRFKNGDEFVWLMDREWQEWAEDFAVVAPESPFCGYCGAGCKAHALAEHPCCNACRDAQGERFPKAARS
jgi:hypothetical protein